MENIDCKKCQFIYFFEGGGLKKCMFCTLVKMLEIMDSPLACLVGLYKL